MKKMIIFLFAFAVAFGAATDVEAGWRKMIESRSSAIWTENSGSHVSGGAHVEITGAGKKSVDVQFTGGTIGPDGAAKISGRIKGTTTDDFVGESSAYVTKEAGEPPVGGTHTSSSSPDIDATASWSYTPNASMTAQEPAATPQQKSYVPLRGAWNR